MDALKLRAVLGLDKKDYDDGLKDAENRAESSGSKISGILMGTAKAAAVGITATSAAVGALVKSSVSEYAEYEQLVGGAQLMFGEAYDSVMNKAKDAYKTVQMSQSEYLKQVNGFATGLKTALGGNEQAAADLADKIITAEADIVAATGNSQEAVQNAFNGIMKSNYTMLDNLQLGITPTKEGMQEVIDKVNEWNAAQGNLTHYTMDNLADQQAALVDYVKMVGVAGYAHDEAADTIQGSLSMLKSAWQNLVTGMSDSSADMSQLIDNVITSAKAVLNNLKPVISQALSGILELVKELGPMISKELPALAQEILPQLIEAGTQLFIGLAEALPGLISVILDTIPQVVQTICDALAEEFPQFEEVFQGIANTVSGVFDFIEQNGDVIIGILEAVLGAFIAFETVQGILKGVALAQEFLNMVMAANPIGLIVTAITMLIGALITLWTTNEDFRNAVKEIWEAITGFFIGAYNKAVEIWNGIGDWFGERWTDIKNAFSEAKEWFSTKFTEFKNSAVNAWSNIKTKFSEIKEKIKSGLNLSEAMTWGKDLIDNFIKGLKEKWEALKQTVSDIAGSIKDLLGFSEPKLGPLSNFHTYAPDMMDLFMKGIRDNKDALLSTVSDAFDFQNLITAPEIDTNIIGNANGNINGQYDTVEKGMTNQTWNVNIYQPMKSAVDVARALRTEAQYGLLGGEALD